MKQFFAGLVTLAFVGFVVVYGVAWLFAGWGTVGAGEKGVKLHWKAVTGEVLGEGLYFKNPFSESVEIVSVQTEKEELTTSAASKDMQSVSAVVALNYHLDPSAVGKIYQQYRHDVKPRVITPAIHEGVKAATARFTAEELLTKREQVRDEIVKNIHEKLSAEGIVVDGFNIIDFDFSKSFNEAIEAKVTAEQNALASKNKLEQVKYEAQQAVEQAKGRAQAISIESEALKSNPQVLELRAIEKWDGHMPQVTSGATPFISLTK
jgi:prohibitin 2